MLHLRLFSQWRTAVETQPHSKQVSRLYLGDDGYRRRKTNNGRCTRPRTSCATAMRMEMLSFMNLILQRWCARHSILRSLRDCLRISGTLTRQNRDFFFGKRYYQNTSHLCGHGAISVMQGTADKLNNPLMLIKMALYVMCREKFAWLQVSPSGHDAYRVSRWWLVTFDLLSYYILVIIINKCVFYYLYNET